MITVCVLCMRLLSLFCRRLGELMRSLFCLTCMQMLGPSTTTTMTIWYVLLVEIWIAGVMQPIYIDFGTQSLFNFKLNSSKILPRKSVYILHYCWVFPLIDSFSTNCSATRSYSTLLMSIYFTYQGLVIYDPALGGWSNLN